MNYTTTNDPAAIAADLRRVADRIDQLVGTDLPLLHVGLHIQAVRYGGSEDARRAAVAALAGVLTPDAPPRDTNYGQYATPQDATPVGCVQVDIYTPGGGAS